MKTKIVNCNCENLYQDETYGKGKRVANLTNKVVGSESVYRCTVCNKEHTKGE